MTVPAQPKLYHIVHVDRLPSIVADECLWCDREVVRRAPPGTTIGMSSIKQRRLNELDAWPAIRAVRRAIACRSTSARVRSCCTLIYRGNHPELSLPRRTGADRPPGGRPARGRRLGRCAAAPLGIHALERGRVLLRGPLRPGAAGRDRLARRRGHGTGAECKEGKQAEFLLEQSFPWHLVERIGVQSRSDIRRRRRNALPAHGPPAAGRDSAGLVLLRDEEPAMIEFTTGDILKDEAEALVNTVNCVGVMGRGIALAVQEGLSRELQGLRGGLQARAGAAGPDVRVRDRAADPAALHHQLPDQAPLARQEPDGGHRGGSRGSGGRDPRAGHPLDRRAAAGQRPGRAATGPRCVRASKPPWPSSTGVQVTVYEPMGAPAAEHRCARRARCRR